MTKCRWGKKGAYRKAADSQSPDYVLQRFGVNVVGEAQWQVWVSDCCGHLAFIRPDLRSDELKVA